MTVKLIRAPVDTRCQDCGKILAFGQWVYYNEESMEALCIECAVKRGWTPKRRVKQLIKALELKADVKALETHRKLLLKTIMLLKQRINILKLGEKDLELENQIVKLMTKVENYLHHCGTNEEATAFTDLSNTIRENQELQKKIREIIQNRTFLLDKKEKKLEKEIPA